MNTGYDFYLDKCLLPITPEKLQIKIKNANKTVTLINEGEVNILKTPGLTEIEFECCIPYTRHPFVKPFTRSIGYYLDYFEKLKVNKRPFQFIVSRALPNGKAFFNTNIKVSMEKYELKESAKDGIDLNVSVKLKQYKDYGIQTVKINQSQNGYNAITTQRGVSSVKSVPVSIGANVVVNGRLYRDSYGNGPGQTKTNYIGMVNFINMNGSHPYHITNQSGGWLGWMAKESVKVV